MTTLLYIAGYIIGFAIGVFFSLWPIKKCCDWFHAGKQGYWPAFLALLLGGIASSIVSYIMKMIVGSMGLGFFLSFLITLIVSLAVYGLVYGKILHVSTMKGLGIFLLSSLITFGIYLLIAGILFGAAYFMGYNLSALETEGLDAAAGPKQYIELKRFESATDKLCACQTSSCVTEYSRELKNLASRVDQSHYTDDEKDQFKKYMEKSIICMSNKADLISADDSSSLNDIDATDSADASDSDDDDEDDASLDDEEKKKKEEPVSKTPTVRHEFKTMTLTEAVNYKGRPAWIVLTDGRVKEGIIIDVSEYDVQLRQQSYGGYMVSYVPRSKIKEVRVYVKR